MDVIESKMTPEDPRKEASVDLKNIVGLLQLRMFSKNNDRTRFLNGEFDFDERRGEELGFKGMMGELNTLVKSLSKEAACNGEAEEQPTLGKLPMAPYRFRYRKEVKLSGTYHVMVDKHNYSLPYRNPRQCGSCPSC